MDRWFISMATDGKDIYWVTEIGNRFCRMELPSNKVSYLNVNNMENLAGPSAILRIHDSNVYAVTNGGKNLVIYNTENQATQIISINCQKWLINMYCYVKIIDEFIVVIPIYGSCALYINRFTGEVKEYPILKEVDLNKQIFALESYEVSDDKIVLISIQSAEIILFSLKERIITERKKIPDLSKSIINFVPYKRGYIILTIDNNLIYIDESKIKELCRFEENELGCAVLHICQDNIWVLPANGENIYTYNLSTNKIKKYKEYPTDYKYTAPSCMAKFTKKCTIDGITYFAMHSGTHIFSIDNNGQGKFINTIWPNVFEKINEMQRHGEIICDNQIELNDFIKFVITEM